MKYKITINGTFASLNEFIAANRVRKGNWSKANTMKAQDQDYIIPYIKKSLRGNRIKPPVTITYHFYEKNRKRDLDNISGYFHKVFQDSLVKCGALDDDSYEYVRGFKDAFDIDKNNPRIEITITEGK